MTRAWDYFVVWLCIAFGTGMYGAVTGGSGIGLDGIFGAALALNIVWFLNRKNKGRFLPYAGMTAGEDWRIILEFGEQSPGDVRCKLALGDAYGLGKALMREAEHEIRRAAAEGGESP